MLIVARPVPVAKKPRRKMLRVALKEHKRGTSLLGTNKP